MKNVFVAGGAGFIGHHLIYRLLVTPGIRRVVVFDNGTSGSFSRLTELSEDPRLVTVRADLKDLSRLTREMAGCDTVFELASNPDIAKANTDPAIDFWDGTYLALNVLEAMRTTGAKRLIYFSGSGVYGENAPVEFSEDYGPMRPISTYGASKLACEALICSYCHMFGIVARAFRFANVVGPRQTHGVGFDFLRKLKADPTKLVILGDGTQSKSYIHVEDVLNAVMLVDSKAEFDYDVFNVATSDYLTVTEIAHMAVELVVGRDVALEYTGGDRGWKGDVPKVRFDCRKIALLGWRCQRNSREAMQAALEVMAEELK